MMPRCNRCEWEHAEEFGNDGADWVCAECAEELKQKLVEQRQVFAKSDSILARRNNELKKEIESLEAHRSAEAKAFEATIKHKDAIIDALAHRCNLFPLSANPADWSEVKSPKEWIEWAIEKTKESKP